ncbi:MAG TPA: cytochrome c3 family protein [Candidatus Krumholzibacteria bacterium]|nr:cytochrome c3 family protein [Candidatus Krumholzibacteria bacterium]
MAAGAPVFVLGLLYLAFWPGTTSVGYQPQQPVPYSHALHAGELGIDCRYCHTGVEVGAKATIPPTATCMNCHATVRTESEKLQLVRDSYATGEPVEWVRVHDLPDFVFFNHSAHVERGIGCESCHGRVDQMEVVSQFAGLNMGWCLKCHREPEAHLRPVDQVTVMGYEPAEDQLTLGARLREARNINPSVDCSTCHR